MEQGIKFIITGDSKGLENATNKAEKDIDALGGKINQLQKDIADNIRITQGYENAIAQLSQEFKSGRISQDQYAKSLARLQRDEKETTIETARLRKELRSLQQDQKSLAAASSSTGQSIGKMGKTVGVNANPALQEFSRVIQDAPFGITGIGNNIQQLTANFGNLSKSAGGTVPALKAMLGALAGPGGILLAVSAVTSLLTVYGDDLLDIATGSNEAAKEQNKLAESLEKYRDSLVGVNRARLEGNREAQEEIVELRLLRGQIENTTLSTEERKDAIKQLRSEFPAYFKGITDESLLNGTASASYDKLTNSILKRAKATAATDLLIENAKTEIDLATQLEEVNNKIAEGDKKRALARANFDKSQEQAYSMGINPAAQAYQKELANNNSLLSEQARLTEEIGKIAAENEKLQSFVTKNVTVEPVVETPKKGELTTGTRPEAIKVPVVLEPTGLAEIPTEGIGDLGKVDIKLPTQDFDDFIKKLGQTQTAVNIFSDATSSAFATMSSSLADSVKTGNKVVDSFVGSIIGSLGQLTSAIIANGIKQLAFKKTETATSVALDATKATGSAISGGAASGAATGPGAIAAIPIMIAALVGVVAAAFASAKKFNHGGIVGGGSFTGDNIMARLNSGERVLTAQDQSMLTRFLRGETMGSTNQMNGTNSVEVYGALRGDTIYLSNQRTAKKNNRFY